MPTLGEFADDHDGYSHQYRTIASFMETYPEVAEEVLAARAGPRVVQYVTIEEWLRAEFGVGFNAKSISHWVRKKQDPKQDS